MARKPGKVPEKHVAELQPDELNALKALVKEFTDKIEAVDDEIGLLKQDRVEIIEEYSDKLDMKTLRAALAIIKIKSQVVHQDTFDLFMEALEKDDIASFARPSSDEEG